MDEAVLALRNLARQCSDSSAMEALARHLFAILGGGLTFPGMGMAEVRALALPGRWGLLGAQCSESSCVRNVNRSTGRMVWMRVSSDLSIDVFVHLVKK